MTPAEITSLILVLHGTSIPLAGVAARNYADRSEWLQKSLTGLDGLLLRLRQTLAEALSVKVTALPDPLPPAILGPQGEQRPAPPVHAGEAYRNAIHDFVREEMPTVLAYANILKAKAGWAWWAHKVSWSTLLLLCYEVIAFSALGLAKLANQEIQKRYSVGSLIPMAILVAIALVGLIGASLHHDRIMDEREKHDPL